MLRLLAGALALATALGSAVLAAAVLAQGADPTPPTPVWNLTTGFAAPESAFYDAGTNAVFVSSINGQILDKDGNGYISRLSPDGKVVVAGGQDSILRVWNGGDGNVLVTFPPPAK